MEVAELFNQLESNQPQTVEEIKKTFHEALNSIRESWLVNGLFEYYLATSSMRPVDILVGVREPHDKHLFDKVSEALKGSFKLQALTFLGHLVRRHPTWVYKITTHPLMKELLKLLKTETEILCLMSALLVIIVLLPMIPTLIGPFLQDIFEIFSRLAAWNTNNPTKLPEEHLLHLQISLYVLFHRLYGMYPCNFLSFLRHEYGQREHLVIFSHTIKPMLETVRMHPLLVTASKDAETSNTRWKKMEDHDVIVECAKFALESTEKSHDDSNYQGLASSLRSRDNLLLQSGKSSSFMSTTLPGEQDFWSPSIHSGLSTPPPQESAPTSIPQTPNSQNYIVGSSLVHQEGTSPPEAAIEATPETTPVRDIRQLTARPLPINSQAVRALNSFGCGKWQGNFTSGSSTPCHSQPSSPMKKESSPFSFTGDNSISAFEQPRRDSTSETRRDIIATQKLQMVQRDIMQVNSEMQSSAERPQLGLRPKTPAQPTSPLRIIPHDASVPNSPVPTEVLAWAQQEKNGFRFENSAEIIGTQADSTQEDQEVLEIVRQGEQLKIDTIPKPVGNVSQRPCDSVLQEIHPAHVDEYEECQQESGSPCTSGGLHMPNSRSMWDFARRVHQQHRQRFYSQCMPESSSDKQVGLSTGSSPGEGSGFHFQERVRRANSCPEMKKGPGLPTLDANIGRTLDESEELLEESEGGTQPLSTGVMINGQSSEGASSSENVTALKRKRLISASTQTVDLVPLPYEHLFLSVFSPIESNGDAKSSITPSPAPIYHQPEPPLIKHTPYHMLDKYIESIVQGYSKEGREVKKPKFTGPETELKILKEQVVLLNIQLHFERQRREVHAERNRRLLRKSINNRALEEHNLALRDQINLLQKDIEQLTKELEKFKKDAKEKEQQLQETINYWQDECVERQKELKSIKVEYQLREKELQMEKEKTLGVMKELQQTEAMLFDMGNEMKQAVAQASVGEQLRDNLEQLQKKLLLMGELQQKYRDRFSQLPLLRHHEDESTILKDAYYEEVKSLQEITESRNSSLESVKARVAELEGVVTRKDTIIADQKKILKQVEEEYHVQLEAVENKYKAQRAINSKMEEHMLELYRQLDHVEDSKRKTTQSPDSSSGHSFSPHNSPLSQSLGSPGGLSVSGLLGKDPIEMKNLQVIVDQPENSSAELPSSSHHQTGSDHPTNAGDEG
ncbi:hamartin isoform X2 [Anabrus simplex]|uniref:hamartin isoform X2 n=1 Tax=Anabrus simplex TaxID=316456 RepID=UPI0035A3335E